jgi:hypothetical protein
MYGRELYLRPAPIRLGAFVGIGVLFEMWHAGIHCAFRAVPWQALYEAQLDCINTSRPLQPVFTTEIFPMPNIEVRFDSCMSLYDV